MIQAFRRTHLVIISTLLAYGAISLHAGELELAIRGEDHRDLPARVRVRDTEGRDHVPTGAQMVKIANKDTWFVCDGNARLSVPGEKAEVRVERGPEYSPIKQTVQLPPTGATRQEFTLTRWINMAQRGYVCGENHLHVSLSEIGPELVAEGLDFGNSLQWWNGPKLKVPADGGFIRALEYAGRQIPTTAYDVELEHEWGAAYLIGVPEPLQARSDPKRPNLPIVRAAHSAGALVCYQGGYSREALLDALLGYVDVVNVCNNNFHRHRFQPRSRYSNLLNVQQFPVYPDTPQGMMHLSTETYYRLLNCGLQLAAGAESATGAKPTPVGYNRAYVRLPEKAGLPEFLTAWKQGRNFVTNGPMLFLKVDGRHEPGDVISADSSPRTLHIEAEALADQPITSLEIIVNGQPLAAEAQVQDRSARVSVIIPLRESCWIAARCTANDTLLTDAELARYDDGNNARPCRLRFAHTSPVYIQVNGQPVRVPASILEAGQMLDAFEVFAMREAAEQYRDEIVEAIKAARQKLARLP